MLDARSSGTNLSTALKSVGLHLTDEQLLNVLQSMKGKDSK